MRLNYNSVDFLYMEILNKMLCNLAEQLVILTYITSEMAQGPYFPQPEGQAGLFSPRCR